jgi:hypothetical protein
MFKVELLATAVVAVENVALVCPSGTVTDAGTVPIAGVELVIWTAMPPAGAGPLRVTRLPVPVLPPAMDAGERDNVERTIGFTVRLALLDAPV